jgi:2-oxoglutarate-Fe(II)-dependent oxygenase superfamily protein
MRQSNLATSRQFQPDHLVICDRKLGFAEIINEEFFIPRKIAELSETFKNNKPFPHLVVEGLFSPILLELMCEDFCILKKDEVRVANYMNEKKVGTRPYTKLGNASELYFNTIHSIRFINFLEQITNIEGLVTDPSRSNGGLHEIPTGGKFAVHVDFNLHKITRLENRLVFITYLNKDWLPAYGGALELWSAEEEKCVPRRSTRQTDVRGHPRPLTIIRMGARMAKAQAFTQKIFFKRRNAARRQRIMTSIKYMTPPIVLDGILKLRARWKK